MNRRKVVFYAALITVVVAFILGLVIVETRLLEDAQKWVVGSEGWAGETIGEAFSYKGNINVFTVTLGFFAYVVVWLVCIGTLVYVIVEAGMPPGFWWRQHDRLKDYLNYDK